MRDLAIYILLFLSVGLFVACATPIASSGKKSLSLARGQCYTFTGSLEAGCSSQTQICDSVLQGLERFESREACMARCEETYAANRKRLPPPFPCNVFVRRANSVCESYCKSLGD